MNVIDEMIQRYRVEQTAAEEEYKRQCQAKLAAAEDAARQALPGIFGDLWETFKPYVQTAQVKQEQVAFVLRLEALELDDFLVLLTFRQGSGWSFYSFANTDWAVLSYSNIGAMLDSLRRRYSAERTRKLLGDLENAQTIEQVHQAAALLLLHEPDESGVWIEKRDMYLQVILAKAEAEAEHKKKLEDFAEAYRKYLVRCVEVRTHNAEVSGLVQTLVNTPRILHELEYGVRGEGGDVSVESVWVADQIPEDGWWQLADGSRKKFFYPVSLGSGREVRPYDRILGTYKSTYCGGDATVYHWVDEDISQIVEDADFWKAPNYAPMVDDIEWDDEVSVCRQVERELVAEGIIQESDTYPF